MAFEPGRRLEPLPLQLVPIINDGTLARGPRRDTAALGTASKIGFRLAGGDLRNAPRHEHLPLEGWPEEHERGARVLGELAPFPALVIREEREATRVDGLQKHGPGRRLPARVGGREHHRGCVGRGVAEDRMPQLMKRDGDAAQPAGAGGIVHLREPPPELNDGVIGEVSAVEAAEAVFTPFVCDRHGLRASSSTGPATPSTVSCQSMLFAGLSTQWFSSGK